MSEDAALVGAAAGRLGSVALRADEAAAALRSAGEAAAADWEGAAERAFLGRVGTVAQTMSRLGGVAAEAAGALRQAGAELAEVETDERLATRRAVGEGLVVVARTVVPYVPDPDPVRAQRQGEVAAAVSRDLRAAGTARRAAHTRLAARLRATTATVPPPLPGAPGYVGPVAPPPEFGVPPPPTPWDRTMDFVLGQPAGVARDSAASIPSALVINARVAEGTSGLVGETTQDIRPNKVNGLWSDAGRKAYNAARDNVELLEKVASSADERASRVPLTLWEVDQVPAVLAAPADAAPGRMGQVVRAAGRVPGLTYLAAGVGMYADHRAGESVEQAVVSQGAAMVVSGVLVTGLLAATAPGWVPVAILVVAGVGVGMAVNDVVDHVWGWFDDDDEEEHR